MGLAMVLPSSPPGAMETKIDVEIDNLLAPREGPVKVVAAILLEGKR